MTVTKAWQFFSFVEKGVNFRTGIQKGLPREEWYVEAAQYLVSILDKVDGEGALLNEFRNLLAHFHCSLTDWRTINS